MVCIHIHAGCLNKKDVIQGGGGSRFWTSCIKFNTANVSSDNMACGDNNKFKDRKDLKIKFLLGSMLDSGCASKKQRSFCACLQGTLPTAGALAGLWGRGWD